MIKEASLKAVIESGMTARAFVQRWWRPIIATSILAGFFTEIGKRLAVVAVLVLKQALALF